MDKRGQFFLITAMILVAIILGFATITNKSKTGEFAELDILADQLKIEAQSVIDYSSYNSVNIETQLTKFADNFSAYSEAENIYFLFGNSTRITVAAYQKNNPGRILVNGIEFNIEQGVFNSNSYDSPDNPTTLTINGLDHDFDLKNGTNFYFIISEGEEEGGYFLTGGVIDNLKN